MIECSTADCAGLNFGATPEHPLGRNSDAAHLLLRVPVVSEQATRVEVEAMLGPNPPGATGIYVLVAYAIDPPCVWVPGSQDAAPLGLGMDGVTWADCNANPDARVPWGGPQGALEHLSPAWGTGEVEVDLATLDPENPSIVAISLDRAEPGPAPRAVLLMVEEVTDTMPFVAFTNESAVHMHVEVTDCP